jgi:hypothetical protein
MALSLNKPKLDNLAGDNWKSAEWLRGNGAGLRHIQKTLDAYAAEKMAA